jgi:hypothetical protein
MAHLRAGLAKTPTYTAVRRQPISAAGATAFVADARADRPSGSWQSVIPVDLVGTATDAIRKITSEVENLSDSACSAVELCDRALLLAYSSIAGPNQNLYYRAIELLNLASERLFRTMPTGIFSGLSSVGWTVEHLYQLLIRGSNTSAEPDDYLADLDIRILGRLEGGRWVGPYDLVGGLVGIGVFFLERLPHRTAAHGLQLILDYLEQQAEYSNIGITWFTPPELVPPDQRTSCPVGYYNLGVAHGVPAVAQFLGELTAAGIEVERARVLLDGLMKWLQVYRQPVDAPSGYSNWIAAEDPGPKTSRVAWCYGDLGIGALLHHLAVRSGRQDWLASSLSLLDSCLMRPEDRVQSAGLCHGALGVAHVYNRIYQAGGDPRYREAAQRYYARGIAMIDYSDCSFLEGSIGEALALISAVFPINPQWDRRLLLSGRQFSYKPDAIGVLPRDV